MVRGLSSARNDWQTRLRAQWAQEATGHFGWAASADGGRITITLPFRAATRLGNTAFIQAIGRK